MAKGKQALAAANRRHQAALDHLDRLTTELVEAKLRARQFEAAAKRVDPLMAEVEKLRRQTDQNTSDYLERMRDRYEAKIADHRDARLTLGLWVFDLLADREIVDDGLAELLRLSGADSMADLNPEHFHSRNHRRNTASPGRMVSHLRTFRQLRGDEIPDKPIHPSHYAPTDDDKADWRQDVTEGNTILGLSEWIAHREESDKGNQ